MGFEMPTSLDGLAVGDLADLRRAAEDAFTDLYAEATKDGATPTADQIAAMEELSSNIEVIDTKYDEVKADDDARRAAAEELAGKVGSRKVEAADDDGDDDDDDDDGEDTDDEDGDGDGADADDKNDDDGADEGADEREDAMAASARRRNRFTGLPGDEGNIPQPDIKGYQMNPHIPGYTDGYVTTRELAAAFDKMHGGSTFGARNEMGNGITGLRLGSLSREFPNQLVADDEKTLTAALDFATDESNLDGGSLTAAGGWCAPSETVYDFLGIPAATELLSLPEVNINRGGIRFPVQPDFGALYNEANLFFNYTEAQMQTDITKPCYEIPCVDFEEIRLEAIGLCVTAGIMQKSGYPELVQVYMDGIMKNHMHRVSAMSLERIRTGSGTPIAIPADNVGSAFGALLNSIELAITDMRLNQRIPLNTTLEVILPVWANGVLRSDLAYRRGARPDVITDADLRAHFAARGANVQYVGDYQVGTAGLPGGATPLTAWPETIEFVVYPAGTWFRSLQNVIEVGVMYDQAQLKKNRYTQLFTEDAFAVGKRGAISRRYTVPLVANGAVGPAIDLAAPTV